MKWDLYFSNSHYQATTKKKNTRWCSHRQYWHMGQDVIDTRCNWLPACTNLHLWGVLLFLSFFEVNFINDLIHRQQERERGVWGNIKTKHILTNTGEWHYRPNPGWVRLAYDQAGFGRVNVVGVWWRSWDELILAPVNMSTEILLNELVAGANLRSERFLFSIFTTSIARCAWGVYLCVGEVERWGSENLVHMIGNRFLGNSVWNI